MENSNKTRHLEELRDQCLKVQSTEHVAIINARNEKMPSGGLWGTVEKRMHNGWVLVEVEGVLVTVHCTRLAELEELGHYGAKHA